jgi:hypothetical protein
MKNFEVTVGENEEETGMLMLVRWIGIQALVYKIQFR